jgi:hypothetical protein
MPAAESIVSLTSYLNILFLGVTDLWRDITLYKDCVTVMYMASCQRKEMEDGNWAGQPRRGNNLEEACGG